MSKKKNKTILGVIGVSLVIFGVIGTIPILLNKFYLGLPFSSLLVIAGLILIGWAISD